MQIYSPTQTRDWGFCPMYWWLKREGWSARQVGKREAAAITGQAFAAGVAMYNMALRDCQPVTKQAVVNAGRLVAEAEIKHAQERFKLSNDFSPEGILSDTEDALLFYMENDPFDSSWTILDVEHTLEQHGKARLDLAVRAPDGVLSVVDYKLKLNLLKKYEDQTVQDYANDHAMFHYAWGYGEERKEVVERYYIALLALRPTKRITLHPFAISPQGAKDWRGLAQNAWDQMGKHQAAPETLWRNPDHRNQYGPCSFKDACLVYGLDEALMKQGRYIKLEET